MKIVKDFIKLESTGGILLLVSTGFAFFLANSGYQELYNKALNYNLSIPFSYLHFPLTSLKWINDGLMALFFCLIGLEVKREIVYGELSTLRKVSLPLVAALGGVIVPAAIYLSFNYDNPQTAQGWAIPTATDIAFALSVLTFFSSRLPISLKTFLLTLAIFDDLSAIVIIALFYHHGGSLWCLLLSVLPVFGLVLLRYFKIRNLGVYFILGFLLWVLVLNSGIHPTIAGVIFAFTIPLEKNENRNHSLLQVLEHKLHPWVAFGILPLFAFANSGITLDKTVWNNTLDSLPISIFCALFFGKQLGIFLSSWAGIKLKWFELPKNATMGQLYGVSILGGIGFTMSLFLGLLSFNNQSNQYMQMIKFSVLAASIISALMGSLVLFLENKRQTKFGNI